MTSTPKVEGAKAAVIVGACRCGQAGDTDVRNGRKNVRMVDAMYEHECADVGMCGFAGVGMCELRLIIWTDEFDSSFLRERFSKYNGLNGLQGARIVTRGWTVD